VKRDREYYGTTPRGPDRINKFDDILSLPIGEPGFKRFITINEVTGEVYYDQEFVSS